MIIPCLPRAKNQLSNASEWFQKSAGFTACSVQHGLHQYQVQRMAGLARVQCPLYVTMNAGDIDVVRVRRLQ